MHAPEVVIFCTDTIINIFYLIIGEPRRRRCAHLDAASFSIKDSLERPDDIYLPIYISQRASTSFLLLIANTIYRPIVNNIDRKKW